MHGLPEIADTLRLAGEHRGGPSPSYFQRHDLATSLIELSSPETTTAETYDTIVTEHGVDDDGRYDDVIPWHGE